MIFYLLAFILSKYRIVEARPVTIWFDRAEPASDPKFFLRRHLSNIIWSCVSTVIICAWTSVHPNLPPPNKWRAGWNRLKIMFWMVVAPELVLAWAARQFFAAAAIRDAYNESRKGVPPWRKWTLSHGHFLGMGGFTVVDPDKRYMKDEEQGGKVLTSGQFEQLLRDPQFEFPDITTAEIQDRSKGDALSKLIAILQSTCFILQCIARAREGLAITELELVTLALASLNTVTFGFWWHKPLGVLEPVKIYWKNAQPVLEPENDQAETYDFELDSPNLSYKDVISKSTEDVKQIVSGFLEIIRDPCEFGPGFALLALFILLPILFYYFVTFPFFVLFPFGIIYLLKILRIDPVTSQAPEWRDHVAIHIIASLQRFRYQATLGITRFVRKWLRDIFDEGGVFFLFGWYFVLPALFFLLLVFLIFLIPFFALFFLMSFIFTCVFGIVTTSTIQPGATHVPLFYASSTKSDRWSRMVVFALFGAIFGGLHCLGWNFKYPTPVEQTFWRTTSSAITIIPLIVAPIDFLLTIRDLESCSGEVQRKVFLILDLVMTVLLFIYVFARLSLIAQALALLRHQPPDILIAVDWTIYLPRVL